MGAQLFANIYKNIFKIISLVNKLIRWPASIVVLRQSVPKAVNVQTFVVIIRNIFCFCRFDPA